MTTLETILTELRATRKEVAELKAANGETFTAKQAASFLRISLSQLTKITAPDNMLIPCSKPGGKVKVFMKSDLMEYLGKYKSKTLSV